MCFIPVSIYIGLYYLVVIPPLAVFPVCFYFAFRSFGFSCHFLEQFLPINKFSIFQHLLHVLSAFLGNVV